MSTRKKGRSQTERLRRKEGQKGWTEKQIRNERKEEQSEEVCDKVVAETDRSRNRQKSILKTPIPISVLGWIANQSVTSKCDIKVDL